MGNNNHISDQKINQLLKKRLLGQMDLDLLEAEAKRVFAAEPFIAYSKIKEETLIKKLNRTGSFKKYFKWGFIGTGLLAMIGLCLVYKFGEPSSKSEQQEPSAKKTAVKGSSNEALVVNKSKLVKRRRIGPLETSRTYSLEFKQGQLVPIILKENADCMNPVLIHDTVVFSPNTPVGIGNELEISNNDPNDLLYFENEHNTVWYKFWPQQDGVLTFDIIPVDPNDDYDFMLYRYNGGDFRSKILSKELKPIRSCISRNDTSIQGKTGLSLNEPATFFIHSGPSQSYVKYLQVKKWETYYLLVDNVYIKGNGHMIRFHYTPDDPNSLYVGKSMVIENVMFVSDEPNFKKGSKNGLDSLHRFLKNNPKLKVEIQGHVNAGTGKHPINYTSLNLSILRAKAIHDYLINKGIPAERLSFAGYADWRKKVEDPKTIKEYRMNILADILILSLDYEADLEWNKLHPGQPSAPH